MEKMKLGVNSAMFDGHPPEVAFRTVRDAGFAYIELTASTILNSSLA